MKIERKYLAHYIDAAPQGSENPQYTRLGQDLEEYRAELSAQVDTKKNILGETAVLISGYEKTAAVEPYYAQAGSPLFVRLQAILDDNQILDQLKTTVVEVKLWEAPTEGAYPAICEEAFLEVTGYGGDTTGYQIPFTVHYTGSKTKGLFHPETKTFTAQA